MFGARLMPSALMYTQAVVFRTTIGCCRQYVDERDTDIPDVTDMLSAILMVAVVGGKPIIWTSQINTLH